MAVVAEHNVLTRRPRRGRRGSDSGHGRQVRGRRGPAWRPSTRRTGRSPGRRHARAWDYDRRLGGQRPRGSRSERRTGGTAVRARNNTHLTGGNHRVVVLVQLHAEPLRGGVILEGPHRESTARGGPVLQPRDREFVAG